MGVCLKQLQQGIQFALLLAEECGKTGEGFSSSLTHFEDTQGPAGSRKL